MHSGKWHIGPNTTDGTYGIDRIAVGGPHDTFAHLNVDRSKSYNNEPKDEKKIDDAIRLLDFSTTVDKPFFLQIWYGTYMHICICICITRNACSAPSAVLSTDITPYCAVAVSPHGHGRRHSLLLLLVSCKVSNDPQPDHPAAVPGRPFH